MSKIIDLFKGKTCSPPPLWFMRQAGRSLPEYRALRKEYKNFLELCYTPKAAIQATLQPVKRFGLDGAILFSDILVVPDALGQTVLFKEGEGPHLSPLTLKNFEHKLSLEKIHDTLAPVYETIVGVKEQEKHVPLIGFAGAPWTVALYMLEGRGSRDFGAAKVQAFQDEAAFSRLLNLLVHTTCDYLLHQIKAGADLLQLFDTWAGLCPAPYFQGWVVDPTKAIIKEIRKTYPTLPVIGFPRGAGVNLLSYGQKTGVSGIGLDSPTPLSWAAETLPAPLVLQGNLDPLLLVAGGESLTKGIHSLHKEMNGRPYIFNLGHGVLPQTPLENIEACVKEVRSLG